MEIKKSQLMVLLLSMFIFTFGFGIIVPVMPYFAKSLGGTVLDIGFLMAAFSAMELIFAPFWGKISDNIGRRPIIIIGLAGFGISFILSGLSTQLWMLYASQIFAGILVSGVYPASTAYIADITSPKERGNLMGMLGAASGLGMIFGPGLSSIFALAGINIPYFAAAAVALLTMLVALISLKESKKPGAQNSAKDNIPLKTSLKLSLKSHVGLFLLLMAFAALALASLEGTFGYYLIDKFGLSEIPSAMPVLGNTLMLTGTNVIGIVFVLFGIIMVIIQGMFVGRTIDRLGEEKTIILGLLLVAAGSLSLIFSNGLISLLLSTTILAVALGLIIPTVNTAVSNRTSPDKQGTVMGLLGSFNSAGRVSGPILGGVAYSISMLLPYLGAAFIAVLGSLIVGSNFKKFDMKKMNVKRLVPDKN